MKTCLGLFDSGVGGFTVLKRILERHREADCLYLGDTARLPYGVRSRSEIREIAREVVEWMLFQDVSAVVVACNTTNSLALDVIEEFADVPVFSLISSAAKMITENRVGVLSTSATASSCSYSHQIKDSRPGTIVIEQACPAFVPMIETGQLGTDELRSIAIRYLEPLLVNQVKEIILGCSHYPLLKPLLKELIPPGVRLIDPAVGLAGNIDSLLGNPRFSLRAAPSLVNTRFCVTSDPCGFASHARHWLGSCPEIELVSLRSEACVF